MLNNNLIDPEFKINSDWYYDIKKRVIVLKGA